MLRTVPHTVLRVGRSYENFSDEFEAHLLHATTPVEGLWSLVIGYVLRLRVWGLWFR